MSEKIDVIPYKIYRAKVQATTKDAKTTNRNIVPTTNRNALTGFTSNRGSTHPKAAFGKQIAKVTYKSSTAKSTSSTSDYTMHQKVPSEKEQRNALSKTTNKLEEFKRQKMEREQEIKQIQYVLNDLTISQQKSTKNTTTSAKPAILPVNIEEKYTPLVRCKSDISHKTQEKLTARESARATTRSTLGGSRSQSSVDTQLKHSDHYTFNTRKPLKKRSHSAVTMTIAQKTALEKETIKKRLEDLRQNTRKIISKNVQKKNKNKTKDRQAEKPRKEENVNVGIINFRQPTPRIKKTMEIVDEKNDRINTKDEKSPAVIQTEKRIGLLRKPEYKDHSYSGIKEIDIDKENFGMNSKTPRRTIRKETRNKSIPTTLSPAPATVIATQDVNVQVTSLSLVTSPRLESEATSAGQKAATKSKCLQEENTQQLKTDLPYWLRPTSVQIYPYNFIRAVRRKLEAVTAPDSIHLETAHVATSTTAFQDVKLDQSTSMCDSQHKQSIVQSLSIKPASPRSLSCSSSNQQQNSLGSKFSSISIQLPPSNTASEVSSLGSEIQLPSPCFKIEKSHTSHIQKQDDDTTVSSSILSNAEVDMKIKRVVSPLNMDKIENLHIESKIDNLHKENIEKGNILKSQKEYLKCTEDKPIDFNKFLQDFNRSLWQVMQVNAQLKCTLDKSQAIYMAKKDENISSKQSTYNPKVKEKEKEICSVTKFPSDTHAHIEALSEQKHENSTVETALENKSFGSKTRSLNVLSPSTINDSYERSLSKCPTSDTIQTSYSSKTSSAQSIEKEQQDSNGSADKKEKRRQTREALIKTNVNSIRGDYQPISNLDAEDILKDNHGNFVTQTVAQREKKQEKLKSSSNPQSKISPKSKKELSFNSSETSSNHCNIALYEKLTQKGVSKEDCLAACLKIREKFILDRTKSQIALLEIQKERFKSKGLLEEIAAIKKKQRGILLKMEREREEIQR